MQRAVNHARSRTPHVTDAASIPQPPRNKGQRAARRPQPRTPHLADASDVAGAEQRPLKVGTLEVRPGALVLACTRARNAAGGPGGSLLLVCCCRSLRQPGLAAKPTPPPPASTVAASAAAATASLALPLPWCRSHCCHCSLSLPVLSLLPPLLPLRSPLPAAAAAALLLPLQTSRRHPPKEALERIAFSNWAPSRSAPSKAVLYAFTSVMSAPRSAAPCACARANCTPDRLVSVCGVGVGWGGGWGWGGCGGGCERGGAPSVLQPANQRDRLPTCPHAHHTHQIRCCAAPATQTAPCRSLSDHLPADSPLHAAHHAAHPPTRKVALLHLHPRQHLAAQVLPAVVAAAKKGARRREGAQGVTQAATGSWLQLPCGGLLQAPWEAGKSPQSSFFPSESLPCARRSLCRPRAIAAALPSALPPHPRMSTFASAMPPPDASMLKVARVSANLSRAARSQRPALSWMGGERPPAASAGAPPLSSSRDAAPAATRLAAQGWRAGAAASGAAHCCCRQSGAAAAAATARRGCHWRCVAGLQAPPLIITQRCMTRRQAEQPAGWWAQGGSVERWQDGPALRREIRT